MRYKFTGAWKCKGTVVTFADTMGSDIMSVLTLNYWLWLAHVLTVRHNLNVLFVCKYNHSSYIVNNNRLLFAPLRANTQTNGMWINKYLRLLYLFMRCVSLCKFLRGEKSLILNLIISDWLFINFKLDLISYLKMNLETRDIA